MSLQYYTAIAKRTQPDDLLVNAIRIALAIYWQMANDHLFPATINPEDTDEAIDILIASLPGLLAKWDPAIGTLTTYLYVRVPQRLRRIISKVHNESKQYETNVFERSADIDIDGNTASEITVGNEDLSDLPINDVVYSDEPLGYMQPQHDAQVLDSIRLLQELADGSLNASAYSRMANCSRQTAHRRREKLLSLLSAK